MERVAGYIRVSSEEQVLGSSLDTQKDEIKKLCNNEGYELCYMLGDEGLTGANDNRPGLQAVMKLAREGKIDIVAVNKIDRLTRSQFDLLKILKELDELGVKFKSVGENFIDTTVASGRFLLQLLGAVAELEREMIRDRTLNGQLASKRAGYWSGPAPYGYDYNKLTKKLDINEVEAEWVRKIYTWYVEEGLTLGSIQQRLNGLDVPTKYDNLGRKKKYGDTHFWGKRTIDRILFNAVYTGVYTFRKFKKPGNIQNQDNLRPAEEWIVVSTPEIIPEETFLRAKIQIEFNKKFSVRNAKHLFMFSGLLKCGDCGGSFTAYKHKSSVQDAGSRYYCVNSKKWVRKVPCTAGSFSEKLLEEPIWDELNKYLSDPEQILRYMRKVAERENSPEELMNKAQELRKLIAVYRDRSRKLVDLYLSEGISREDYNKRKSELESRIKNDESELDRVNGLISALGGSNVIGDSIQGLTERYGYNLSKMSPDKKRELYKMIISKITLKESVAEVFCSLPVLSDTQRVAGNFK